MTISGAGSSCARLASDFEFAGDLECDLKSVVSATPASLRQISAKRDDTAIAEGGIRAIAASTEQHGRNDRARMDERDVHAGEEHGSAFVNT